MSARPHFAHAGQPLIAAMLEGMLRLPSRAAAQERIRRVSRTCIISRRHSRIREGVVALWIKGYGVSEAEAQEGYLGHYARLTAVQHGEYWTISAEKMPVALARHPQRRYVAGKVHPNWGHPLLRRIRRHTPYASAEEAQEALMTLHAQYPDASIPARGKLYLMVYGKPPRAEDAAKAGSAPISKYIFTLRALPEGGCLVEYALNLRTPEALPKAARKDAAKKPQGYFATLVKLKRKEKLPAPKLEGEG
jgi:hypothetical protein